MKNYYISDAHHHPVLLEIPRDWVVMDITGHWFEIGSYVGITFLKKYIRTLKLDVYDIMHRLCWYQGNWVKRWIIRFTKPSDAIKFKLCFNQEKLDACIR